MTTTIETADQAASRLIAELKITGVEDYDVLAGDDDFILIDREYGSPTRVSCVRPNDWERWAHHVLAGDDFILSDREYGSPTRVSCVRHNDWERWAHHDDDGSSRELLRAAIEYALELDKRNQEEV